MTSGIICLPRHLRGDALTAWMLRKPSSAPTFRIRTKIILVGLIHAFQRAEGNTSSVHSVSLHSHSSLFVHSLSLSLSLLALVLLLLSPILFPLSFHPPPPDVLLSWVCVCMQGEEPVLCLVCLCAIVVSRSFTKYPPPPPPIFFQGVRGREKLFRCSQ